MQLPLESYKAQIRRNMLTLNIPFAQGDWRIEGPPLPILISFQAHQKSALAPPPS